MKFSLFYNPFDLIERLAIEIKRQRRLKKLSNTPGANLKLGHIDSLELLEITATTLKDPIIYDIGANIGTWTLLAKSIFPSAIIYAFEPLPKHIEIFKVNCSELANVHMHPYCVGNEDIIGSLNISSFSDSSSLLVATPLEFESYNIVKESEVSVDVKRLDSLIEQDVLPLPNIIKLDIQGFELEALKGMGQYLSSVEYIICEVSFKEYYQGQALFLDIANYLAPFNHQLFALGYNSPIGQELDQMDVLFKRTN